MAEGRPPRPGSAASCSTRQPSARAGRRSAVAAANTPEVGAWLTDVYQYTSAQQDGVAELVTEQGADHGVLARRPDGVRAAAGVVRGAAAEPQGVRRRRRGGEGGVAATVARVRGGRTRAPPAGHDDAVMAARQATASPPQVEAADARARARRSRDLLAGRRIADRRCCRLLPAPALLHRSLQPRARTLRPDTRRRRELTGELAAFSTELWRDFLGDDVDARDPRTATISFPTWVLAAAFVLLVLGAVFGRAARAAAAPGSPAARSCCCSRRS